MKALTPQELYKRAISYHGTEHYDYTNTDFSSLKTDTSVYCNYCKKEFPVNLGRHLATKKPSGCPSCKFKKLSKLYMLSEEDFKEDCRKVHKGHYLYPEGITIYKGNKESIVYICPEHGLREQNAGKHKSGQGCALCEGSYKRSLEDIHDYMNKHKEMFSDIQLLSTEYVNNGTHMQWRCLNKDCGHEYPASWGKIKGTRGKKGRRCPECARRNSTGNYTFKVLNRSKEEYKKKDSIVYILKFRSDEEEFYKIGITVKPITHRHSPSAIHPYTFEVLKIYKTDRFTGGCLEKWLQDIHKEYEYRPKHKFGGHTECYTFVKPISKLDTYLDKLNKANIKEYDGYIKNVQELEEFVNKALK